MKKYQKSKTLPQNLLGRQDEWIRQCIQLFSNDETKMYCLFSVISKLEIERKKEYILLFLENNPLFEDLKKTINTYFLELVG